MADVSITAANVRATEGCPRGSGTAGESITAGAPLYKGTDGKLYKAIKTSMAAASVVGIALHAAGTDQPITYVTQDDDFTPGFTLVVGTAYYVGAAAGGISAFADLTTGNFATLLMVAKTTTKAKVRIVPVETAVA